MVVILELTPDQNTRKALFDSRVKCKAINISTYEMFLIKDKFRL